jgi:hypothetical protein
MTKSLSFKIFIITLFCASTFIFLNSLIASPYEQVTTEAMPSGDTILRCPNGGYANRATGEAYGVKVSPGIGLHC